MLRDLKIISGPSVEPVTLNELKQHLRLDLAFTDDDAMLTSYITAARQFAEKVTDLSIAVKSYAAFFNGFPRIGCPLMIPKPPLVTVTAIKYLDSSYTWQTWDPLEYFIAATQTPGIVVAKTPNIYPCPITGVPGAVEVDFTSGYAVVEENIKRAIKVIAQHYYDHPELVSAENEKEIPASAMRVLGGYKFYWPTVDFTR